MLELRGLQLHRSSGRIRAHAGGQLENTFSVYFQQTGVRMGVRWNWAGVVCRSRPGLTAIFSHAGGGGVGGWGRDSVWVVVRWGGTTNVQAHVYSICGALTMWVVCFAVGRSTARCS